MPVYGDGENIRDWLYVEDHVNALEILMNSEIIQDSFCIGGNNEIQNIVLIEKR